MSDMAIYRQLPSLSAVYLDECWHYATRAVNIRGVEPRSHSGDRDNASLSGASQRQILAGSPSGTSCGSRCCVSTCSPNTILGFNVPCRQAGLVGSRFLSHSCPCCLRSSGSLLNERYGDLSPVNASVSSAGSGSRTESRRL